MVKKHENATAASGLFAGETGGNGGKKFRRTQILFDGDKECWSRVTFNTDPSKC